MKPPIFSSNSQQHRLVSLFHISDTDDQAQNTQEFKVFQLTIAEQVNFPQQTVSFTFKDCCLVKI
jgi:hypothetical protein